MAIVMTLALEEKEGTTLVVRHSNRCGTCNKKVGMLGFKCKCGATLCGSHRHPEDHACAHDFKEAGKRVLAKANPVVKADKITRF